MRAEELASQLDNYTTSNKRVLVNWSNDAAAMLRRQSSEIERLEARVKELTEALQSAKSIIGHPDDYFSKYIGALLEKSNG